MNEIWTREAKITFTENIEYLKKRWTTKEVNEFVEKTFKVIDMIKLNPNIGQYDRVWEASKFLVVSQIYLFYDLIDGDLVLITFWNNYQKPL